MKDQCGVLLLNLGTPDQPTAIDVKRYLKEFLMDPYVIDIHYLLRWPLVNWGILPKRSVASASLYSKIWHPEKGSPLLYHLKNLVSQVQQKLGEEWVVKSAMRYGNPSISTAIAELQEKSIKNILIFPLYPQYSTAATESSIQECRRQMGQLNYSDASLKFIDPFYQDDLFIDSFVSVIQDSLIGYPFDHLLFSFHGLPERQVKKTDRTGAHCLSKSDCCAHPQAMDANPNCYRAQCFISAQLMARRLGLSDGQYTVCFQSRLGRTPWIKPFTDELYRELPKKGVKRLAVACPSFVADCLETLEEVQIRGQKEFVLNGGQELRLVPSLNSSPRWVEAVSQMILNSSDRQLW